MKLIKKFELIYDKYFKTNLKSRFVFVPHAHVKYSGFCAFIALNYIDWKSTKEIILISTNHFSSENITPKNSKINDGPKVNKETPKKGVARSIAGSIPNGD